MALSRRRAMATGLATLGLGTVGTAAREGTGTAILPEELMPRVGRMQGTFQPGEIHVAPDDYALYWTPTPDMIEREPEKYARFADGMPGGIDNPLGARALYLFTPERGDTFLRIHGTNESAARSPTAAPGW